MISKEQLDNITSFLKWAIFRNPHIMLEELPGVVINPGEEKEKQIEVDLTDIIATLHNLLCEAITGERYDYMWHWANKIGSWCSDDVFDDDFIKRCQEEE